MAEDTGGGPGLVADQHIGALVGALSVLDTRLLSDWGRRLAALMGRGGRLLAAGTGESAVQAELFAAQVSGRVAAGRGRYQAIALHSSGGATPRTPRGAPDGSAIVSGARRSAAVPAVSAETGGAGPEEVFARQVRSHGRPGDVLLTVSPSGRNHRLLRAVAAARAGGIVAWCLTGPAPNPLADACDEAVCVYPAGARALSLAATVQEAHQVALHLICLAFDAVGPASGG